MSFGTAVSSKRAQWGQVIDPYSTSFTFAFGLPITKPPFGVLLTTSVQSCALDLECAVFAGVVEAASACWALDPPGAAVYATHAPYNPAADTMSLVLRRAEAPSATFAALFAPFTGAPVVRQATWTDQSANGATALTVLVEGDGWRDAWVVGSAPRNPAHDPPAFAGATVREHVLAQ